MRLTYLTFFLISLLYVNATTTTTSSSSSSTVVDGDTTIEIEEEIIFIDEISESTTISYVDCNVTMVSAYWGLEDMTDVV